MAMTGSGSADTVLGEDLYVEGKLEGDGNIRVTGRIKGEVAVTGDVTIDPGASIEGAVRADRVLLAGSGHANIVARSAVELTGSAALVGDVKAPTVVVAAGAMMRGRVESGVEGEQGQGPTGKRLGERRRGPGSQPIPGGDLS